MKCEWTNALAWAKEMDEKDPLASFKSRFYCAPGRIYMDGNSLGLCSRDAEKRVLQALEAWKRDAIGIWSTEGGKYFLYPARLAARIAPLVGALPQEITVTNSTTMNIHQALATFYKPTPGRYKLLVDELNFPTDKYAVDSQARLHGFDPQDAVKVVKSQDGRYLDEDAIIEAMTGDVAVALLPTALYRSAQLLNVERLTAAAHARGVIIGFDLCHSIGAVAHDLHGANADFAVWCNYKYLNGGPGTVAGLFIHQRHLGRGPGMAGWQGNEKSTQFQLRQEYQPAPDADGWLTGTPPILSMAAIEGSLDIYQEAGLGRIREKSLALTSFLIRLIDEELTQYGYAVGSPREEALRGGHVALEHPEAYRICQALKAQNVIPDYREPNVVRLAPAALYVSFEEVYRTVEILKAIARNKLYEQYSDVRVTDVPL